MSTSIKYKESSNVWKNLEINKENLSQELLDFIYPVGSLYFSYTNNSPANFFGGSWIQITNRFIRAANDINTGGADTHKLTLNQLPIWQTSIRSRRSSLGSAIIWKSSSNPNSALSQTTYTGGDVSILTGQSTHGNADDFVWNFGNDEAHNNMPAYQDIYCWYRSA